MVNRILKAGTALALLAGIAAAPASAAIILNFAQQGSGTPFSGTQTSTTTSSLAATNALVTINYGATSVSGYFNFAADSTGAATGSAPTYSQNFAGTFSVTSGLNGSGTDYLSGSFGSMAFGWGGTANVGASQPFQSVSFVSDVISDLGSPRSLSLSLVVDTANGVGFGICDSTLCSFTSSVTGTFGGSAVPEPASWAMMVGGFGMLGGALRRRRTTTAISFG